KRARKGVAPDIQLSVEPSARNSQRSESSTDPANEGSDASRSTVPSLEGRSGASAENPRPTRRTSRIRRSTENRDDEPSGTYSTEPDKQLVPDETVQPDDSDKPKARTHRPTRRTRSGDDTSRTTTKEKNSEVQKGESIDP